MRYRWPWGGKTLVNRCRVKSTYDAPKRLIHVMGCVKGLADALGLVPVSARVVRELYNRFHGGTRLDA